MKGNNQAQSHHTCPNCNGDGGTRGGCYKCFGSGFVSLEEKQSYQQIRGDKSVFSNSKISNFDYKGHNIGGHSRDTDGTIGSMPLYEEDY